MRNPILKAIAIILIVIAAFFLLKAVVGWLRPSAATISGTLTVNGYIPEGSVIKTYGRQIESETSSAQYDELGTRPAQPFIQFSWDKAEVDNVYQAYVVLTTDGKEVAKSNVETVKAPATNVRFVINSPLRPPEEKAELNTISGTVRVNGAIPSGATITIEGRKNNASNWETVANNIPAAQSVQWSFNEAEGGATYVGRARLISGGSNIGTSDAVTVTAPARNIEMTVNSTYAPPQAQAPEKTTVSGSLFVNGSIPSSSSFRVLARKAGSGNYETIVDNLAAVNGVRWEWGNALTGVVYDFKSQVMQSGVVLAEAVSTDITAPASNVDMTITMNAPLTAPPTAPRTSCDGKNGSVWTVSTTVDAVKDSRARQYWLMVGTQPGFSDTFSTRWAHGTDLEYRFRIENIEENRDYYTQYAWSDCADCTAAGQFSPFTRSSFRCPQ